MGETITSKGKTTKKALDLALKRLNKDISEVDIEILNYEKKSILGFKTEPAIVKVTAKETMGELVNDFSIVEKILSVDMDKKQEMPTIIQQELPLEIDANLIDKELSGKAWVINGKVFCKDAINKYALIEPTEGISLYKNGKLIHSIVTINENDVINIETNNDEILPSWDIKISADNMEAYLVIKAGLKVSRVLKDQKPSSYIKLEAEEVRTPLTISQDEVLNELRRLHILHGIDYEAIRNACALGKDGTFLIAKGRTPIKGENGFFQLNNNYEEKNQMKERLNGSIDFKEFREFPSVDYGQIIGEVVPPVEGRAGITVVGRTVEPEKVYPLKLRAGTGVLIVDDSKAVATEAGSPEVRMSKDMAIVSVFPKLTINNDVTMETGNVHYLGGVNVKASIQDGMTVEANGKILIEGSTFRSKVLSGKSVIVENNVIASHLTVGNGSPIKIELSQLLTILIYELDKMNAAIKQLSQISAFKAESHEINGLGPIIKLLCDSKFKDFQSLIVNIVKKIKAASTTLETKWIDFAEQLYRDFVTVQMSTIKTRQDLMKIAKKAETLCFSVTTDNNYESNLIKADYVQNSHLYSNGDIFISGKGVYISKLFARRNIKVDGFVRGGDLYADGNISINEVGARAGSNMKISVSKKGSIKINYASENTIIEVGKQSEILFTKAKNVFAKLDDFGRLVVDKEEYSFQY